MLISRIKPIIEMIHKMFQNFPPKFQNANKKTNQRRFATSCWAIKLRDTAGTRRIWTITKRWSVVAEEMLGWDRRRMETCFKRCWLVIHVVRWTKIKQNIRTFQTIITYCREEICRTEFYQCNKLRRICGLKRGIYMLGVKDNTFNNNFTYIYIIWKPIICWYENF